jgi:sugar lactone lactonase YvrE
MRRRSRIRRGVLHLLAVLVLLTLTPAVAAAAQFPVRVFARMPDPGFPANAVLGPDGLVYAGSFKPLLGGTPDVPSRVFAFAPDGSVVRSYAIAGQTPGAVHAVQVASVDRSGRLYLLDQDPARVVVLDPRTGAQATWATFSTLPGSGGPPEPDFAAWGPDGSLYVTDYAQYVVWRIPPAGGAARVWLNDPRLNGTIVGPAGIELMADRRTLMLSTGAGGSNTVTGKLYTVPIQTGGSPGPLHQIWESGATEAPDGFAISRSGRIWVALVGPAGNAVAEVSPTGATLARVPANAVANALQPIPFDAPGSVTFDGSRILVANQSAILQNHADMALLEVGIGETGLPLSLPPAAPGARAPRLPALRLIVRPERVLSGRVVRLRFAVAAVTGSRPADRVRRPVDGALIRFRGRSLRTGRNGRASALFRFTLPGRRTFVARAAGFRSTLAIVRVTW